MKKMRILSHPYLLSLTLAAILAFLSCAGSGDDPVPDMPVKTGAQVLLDEHLADLEGKRVGLVMNPSSRIGKTHMLDTLLAHDVNVTALYAPEHGFRGEAGAGDRIEDGIDMTTGLPVFSLYGATRKPTADMLSSVDLILFDVQDVGARFYTYISTLGLVMESAAENGVELWVLDRPNPLGGDYVSGWILENEFESFVGFYPIPIAHGLTMGEMAKMIAGERWMNFDQEPKLRIIPMSGWKRSMKWPDTGLEWIAPSPNLPTFEQAFIYPGTVFFEGTSLSEGRGTDQPFLTLGSPKTRLDAENFNILSGLDGISFTPHTFTPRSIPGVAPRPKHEGEQCEGVILEVDSYDIDPVRTGLKVFTFLIKNTEDAEIKPFLYNLAGTRKIDGVLSGELDPDTLDFGLDSFLIKRAPYLIYN
jgi:uncharacterized protein YbbC (DUF1343 family)